MGFTLVVPRFVEMNPAEVEGFVLGPCPFPFKCVLPFVVAEPREDFLEVGQGLVKRICFFNALEDSIHLCKFLIFVKLYNVLMHYCKRSR